MRYPFFVLLAYLAFFNFVNAQQTVERKLFDNKLSIMLPDEWVKATADQLNKYPKEARPSESWYSPTAGHILAINRTNDSAGIAYLEFYLDKMITQVEQNSYMQVIDSKFIPEKRLAYFEIESISGPKERAIYQLNFFTDIGGEMILFSYTVPKILKNSWATRAREMMFSLKVLD